MSASILVGVSVSQDEAYQKAIELISRAGYTIVSTSDRDRTITYEASGGAWAWKQKVKLDFGKKTKDTASLLVTVKEQGFSFFQGKKQIEILAWVLKSLGEQFQIALPPGEVADYLNLKR
jgi:hypothetical protein